MSTTLFPAFAAAVFGVLLALMLVVPFVAIQYRRRGGLTVGVVFLHFLVLIYLVAVVTYTLLPLPENNGDFCSVYQAGVQLVPGQFVNDILTEAAGQGGGVNAFLRNPALLQVVFNVALFVPLGMIVRYFTKRTVLVTALIGFGVSLLIETTQITGDWFLYPCAYRLFDVDDLIANSTGSLLGAFLAPLLGVIPGQTLAAPGTPRPVTALRRLLGMLCDWMIVSLGAAAVSFVYAVVTLDRATDVTPVDSFFRAVAGPLLMAAVELVWILRTGRTIGETVVRLAPVPPTRLPGRLIRWASGIGGYTVVGISENAVASTLLSLVVLVSVVLAFTTLHHRGLSYVLAGWRLHDDRVRDAAIEASRPVEGRDAA
ncbi:VanZ family protein [Subtercola sp. Z020]|uniref:VanZ family protein n=1 Tax=Subtercola sp. Z020 TaxID=2080582 RepID=UPI0011B0A36D|nr:VanZ family protein [Subtercola sp. Z020]